MINLKLLMEGKYDYGCVMARIDEIAANKLFEFNCKFIPNEVLHEEEGHEYGRELVPHITLKYGLVESYTEQQMKQMLQNVTPFDVQIKGVGVFENESFDVVKFDVDGEGLRALNEMLSKLPNQDQHPEYHPHMTMAYVKKGMGNRFIKNTGKFARVPVNLIEYSNKGIKTFYQLQEAKGKMPSQMYHGTPKTLSNKVWKYGLIPGGNRRRHPGFEYENGVYLTTNIEVARHFGQDDLGRDEVVILTVDTSKLDPKKAKVDPNTPNSIIYFDKIPADKIIDWKIVDPPSIYEIKLKELLSETDHSVWFGAIWPDETIRAIKTNDKNARHPQEWQSCVKWRYVPEIEYLNWWETPSKKEEMLVHDYIERRGHKIEHVNVYTARAVTENKELLMERASAKDLEAFLRAMIQGTEWAGKVFLVGGFVRDELLGKEPKDADIVVWKNQGGIEFNTWLAKKLGIYKDTNPVNTSNFGTSTLRLDGVVWNGIDFTGEMVDAVMFRKEQYHDPNSRKPTVQYTDDIRVDASRRDLTFNSLYKDISSGEILDPTGKGKNDLKNGIIRTPIDPTLIYTDDALRMFRAVRFAAQLGFELSPEVVDGIKKNLHRLGNTSKERIRDELNKILVSKNAARGIRILRDTGLLPYVARELQQAVGMTQNVHHTHDVFDHTMDVIEKTKPELIQRLIGLFHDIGKVVTRSETPTGVHFIGHEDAGLEIVERTMRELKYPNDLIEAVKLGVANHMRLKQGGDEANLTDKTLRKFKIALGDQLENVLDVIHADNISHADASAMPNQIARVRARLQTLDVQVKKPNLPINGNDLQAMGLKPGPMIGKILGAVTDAWYENPNITREEALEIAKRMI